MYSRLNYLPFNLTNCFLIFSPKSYACLSFSVFLSKSSLYKTPSTVKLFKGSIPKCPNQCSIVCIICSFSFLLFPALIATDTPFLPLGIVVPSGCVSPNQGDEPGGGGVHSPVFTACFARKVCKNPSLRPFKQP